jgi:hypothetical protein
VYSYLSLKVIRVQLTTRDTTNTREVDTLGSNRYNSLLIAGRNSPSLGLITRDVTDTRKVDSLGRSWYYFLTAGHISYFPVFVCVCVCVCSVPCCAAKSLPGLFVRFGRVSVRHTSNRVVGMQLMYFLNREVDSSGRNRYRICTHFGTQLTQFLDRGTQLASPLPSTLARITLMGYITYHSSTSQ